MFETSCRCAMIFAAHQSFTPEARVHVSAANLQDSNAVSATESRSSQQLPFGNPKYAKRTSGTRVNPTPASRKYVHCSHLLLSTKIHGIAETGPVSCQSIGKT